MSDGKGNKKRHCVKWEWFCQVRSQGGLGLKDIKAQGLVLASKWVLKALWGDEPWKILIRDNLLKSIIRKGKNWNDLPVIDIVLGEFKMRLFGSKIFQTFWKAWIQVRKYIQVREATEGPPYFHVRDRSIWWGLSYTNKALALT